MDVINVNHNYLLNIELSLIEIWIPFSQLCQRK